MGGTGVYSLVHGTGSCPSGEQRCVKGVFIDGCELSMALGTLSANEFICVLTLLIISSEAFQHWIL